jgi:hypothetical protein
MGDQKTELLPLAWEKARVASVIVATLAIPLVVAYIGSSLSRAQKQDEISARYVELAVDILRSQPSKDTRALRSWAILVVNHFSQVPLSKEVQEELQLRAFAGEARQVRSLVESVLRDMQPASAPGAERKASDGQSVQR